VSVSDKRGIGRLVGAVSRNVARHSGQQNGHSLGRSARCALANLIDCHDDNLQVHQFFRGAMNGTGAAISLGFLAARSNRAGCTFAIYGGSNYLLMSDANGD
jgi:hypothetical protein